MYNKDYSDTAEEAAGSFAAFDGDMYYKIENYDSMPDFFMTITSSSDAWNFLWSKGGITAGRGDADHAIFPYYTADIVSDMKHCTGPFSAVKISDAQTGGTVYWEPFADEEHAAFGQGQSGGSGTRRVSRCLYKNTSGSKIIFEETLNDYGLVFRRMWTSCSRFGLVSKVTVHNTGSGGRALQLEILDGCRNILPACTDAAFQNTKSVLLDAYKQTDIDAESGLVIFGLSAVVTDKAEPSEALYANVSWFSDDAPVCADQSIIRAFRCGAEFDARTIVPGQRGACFSVRKIRLERNTSYSWKQVFDTFLSSSRIADLAALLKDKKKADLLLEQDMSSAQEKLESIISAADGVQRTADDVVCIHHKANVLFNVMRGGYFAENDTVHTSDFLAFAAERNPALAAECAAVLRSSAVLGASSEAETVSYRQLYDTFSQASSAVFRLFLEYLPLSFSRRHGDPSRPWNRFSIRTGGNDGSPVLSYEGNWRDIFQNWEALALSYPAYLEGMIAKFLNAVTIDGFNPYRIMRSGIEWEAPEPDDPWSNIGYWNDHQVIYLLRLLELQYRIDAPKLFGCLNRAVYTTALVPYRIKPYAQICADPRDTIVFDRVLDAAVKAQIPQIGTDAKLVRSGSQGAEGSVPALVPLAAKLLQILCTKLANYVPCGGIWLNTQRPEWNDANNALAGYGLSMVTLYYVRRYVSFLMKLFRESGADSYTVPQELAALYTGLTELFSASEPASVCDPQKRKSFVDAAGLLFERERESLYAAGYTGSAELRAEYVLASLETFLKHIDYAAEANRRSDGLFHSYNTLSIGSDSMTVSYLSEMLEGQVAVLSSGYLNGTEAADVCRALESSALYEKRQHSYILYPDKKLPRFTDKNRIAREAAERIPVLKKMLDDKDRRIIEQDGSGFCHFNADFKNAGLLTEALNAAGIAEHADDILGLYEQVFNHASFTGRSGTFYAYEGLGSIYWHMVSKLLLAVQECFFAEKEHAEAKIGLARYYYRIRSGLGFNKTPALYGAFPTDPYSHTPSGQGARQPGMTGQVKEEIITRWGELGLFIENGCLSVRPDLLKKREFTAPGTLEFLRFGIPFVYKLAESRNDECICINDVRHEGLILDADMSRKIFSRSGAIRSVMVNIAEDRLYAE